jgi:hypothetical protein
MFIHIPHLHRVAFQVIQLPLIDVIVKMNQLIAICGNAIEMDLPDHRRLVSVCLQKFREVGLIPIEELQVVLFPVYKTMLSGKKHTLLGALMELVTVERVNRTPSSARRSM